MVRIFYLHLVHHALQITPQVKKSSRLPGLPEVWRTRRPLHGIAATNPMTWELPI